MVRPVKKVPLQPGTFRTGFTKLEYGMLETALKCYVTAINRKRTHVTPRERHYLELITRVQHGKRRIDQQLELYRKVNNLERCKYLEPRPYNRSYVFTKS